MNMPSTYTYAQVCASEQREQAQTEAYADGRADERMEWAPVLDVLYEVLEYLDDCSDVVDGSYGEPKPNRAMVLAGLLREATGEHDDSRLVAGAGTVGTAGVGP
jgi:hypothetical protein